MKKFNLIIFGATGFTGQYVVEEVAKVSKIEEENARPLTWAVAGRNREKLQKSLEIAKEETGLSLSDVGIIEADVNDKSSLIKMAEQANVVLNCVGPYVHYGEPVVEACILTGTNHVDISGEPQFLEGVQLRHHEAAAKAGVYIVGSCGLDSIPAELGYAYLMENFKGILNEVNQYLKVENMGPETSIHTGTMESCIYSIVRGSVARDIRAKLLPEALPKQNYPVTKSGGLHHVPELNCWGLRMPVDEPVVKRSQHYFYKNQYIRPAKYRSFYSVNSVFTAIGIMLAVAVFAMMSVFSRKLLIKYPEIMTAGVFTRAGPDRKALKKVSFTTTLIGYGWKNLSDACKVPPDTSLTVRICGPDPGYEATSIMMVASAMTILREKEECAEKGGVFTPGVAFKDTSLIECLRERGITFEVRH